jgi:hypothetical protein
MMFFLVLFFHTIFCMVQMFGLSYAMYERNNNFLNNLKQNN